MRWFNSAGASVNSNVVSIQTTALPQGEGWVSITISDFKDYQGNVLLSNTVDDRSVAYEDFTGTGKAIRAEPSDVLSFLIEGSHGADEATKIWVDKKGDGAFYEGGELLVNVNLGNSVGTMTVPADMALDS